jgi:hypothetical protein
MAAASAVRSLTRQHFSRQEPELLPYCDVVLDQRTKSTFARARFPLVGQASASCLRSPCWALLVSPFLGPFA